MPTSEQAKYRRFPTRLTTLFALLALAVGCGKGESGVRYRLVERLSPPGGFAVESIVRDAPPLVWNFDSLDDTTIEQDGKPPWQLRKVDDSPKIVDGMLTFQAGGDSQMLLEGDLSLLEYGRIEIIMLTEDGQYGQVFWAAENHPIDTGRSSRFRLLRRRSAQTYTTEIGRYADSEFRIARLRFDPTDTPGEVRIDSIRLLPPEPEQVARFSDRGRVVLSKTFRDGKVLVDDYSWTGEVDYPDDALLRFTFGAPASSRVEFRLSADRGEGDRDREIFRVRKGTGEWVERVVRAKKLGDRFTFTATMKKPADTALLATVEVLEVEEAPLSAAAEPGTRTAEAAAEAAVAIRPNVLLIVVDTLRADRLSCYGYDKITSPRLDEFAADAVRFDNATPQCTWTLPSVASLLTGMYASELPIQWGGNLGMPDWADPFATKLQNNGYATGCVFANGILDIDWGYDRGFDTFTLGVNNELTADKVTRRGIEWLESHGDEAFFLYLHYVDPHDGYEPPTGDNPFVGPDDPTFPAERITELQKELVPLQGPEELAAIKNAYDGEIFFADREIGRLLRYLDTKGLDRSTLVVFTADHGEEFLDHGGWRHGTNLYNENARVPLLMRLPDRARAGSVVRDPVELIDLAPTILDFTGIGVGPDDALSGSSLLRDAVEPGPHLSFSETHANGPVRISVNDGTWKYVRFERDRPHVNPRETIYKNLMKIHPVEGLYHLGEDPGEIDNRIEDEADRAARMRERVSEHLAGTRARKPIDPAGMDEDTRRRLQKLGYVQPEPAAPSPPNEGGADSDGAGS